MILAPKLGMDVSPGRFVFKKPRTFEESITLCVRVAEHLRTKKLIPPRRRSRGSSTAWPRWSRSRPWSTQDRQGQVGRGPQHERQHGARPRHLGSHAAFAQYCDELGICAIFLNQIRMKMGVMYGDPRTTPGGEAPKFYASQRIMLGSSQIKKGTEIIGAEVTAAIIKTRSPRPSRRRATVSCSRPTAPAASTSSARREFLDGIGALESAGPGFVKWNGVRIGKEALARKIQAENGMDELRALLPGELRASGCRGRRAARAA